MHHSRQKILRGNSKPFLFLFSFILRAISFYGVRKDGIPLSYADDNTPYTTGVNNEEVITELEKETSSLFKWFFDNMMKANPDKCHLLLNRDCELGIKVGNMSIENSKYEKLLGIEVDNKLNFNMHVVNLCKKASRKMHALARAFYEFTPFYEFTKKTHSTKRIL